MDLLCGPFTPALIPDWLSKVGPAVAALVATSLYGLTRWHAGRDLTAKRDVLLSILGETIGRVWVCMCHLQTALDETCKVRDDGEFEKRSADRCARVLESFELLMERNSQRLYDLQDELVRLARNGDDTFAIFIEGYRTLDECVQSALAVSQKRGPLDVDTVRDIQSVLDDVVPLCDDAMSVLTRRYPRLARYRTQYRFGEQPEEAEEEQVAITSV